MKRILILSKNPLAEQDLQCSLQRMNEEVYCSSSLLSQAGSCLDLLHHFSVVILSDTITTLELEVYLPILLKTNASIFRKGDREFLKHGEYAWMLDKIDFWIEEQTTITEIAETLAKITVVNNRDLTNKSQNQLKSLSHHLPTLDFNRFISCLSKNETKVLFHIYEAKGCTISREELCQAIWEMPPTNSNLSQLSSIIYRIKIKIKEMGFDGDELQTVWGQGYRMENVLRSFLSQK